jgi:2-C-methyl-D-erythritol 4-phosphate cytidylyltransferase
VRLRQALAEAPAAKRLVIKSQADLPAPFAGEAGGGLVAVYGAPVADTCKEVADGLVVRTVPRDSVAIALGPWVFERDAMSSALLMVAGRESEIDSLLTLCELARLQVRVLPLS